MIERAFNRMSKARILGPGVRIRYLLDDIMKGDERSRALMLGKLVRDGLISPNEARKDLGKQPLSESEGLDAYDDTWVPVSFQPTSTMRGTITARDEGGDKLAGVSEEEVTMSQLAEVMREIVAEMAESNGHLV